MARRSPADVAGEWVDPGAVQAMVESVRAAYAAAPAWVQIGLPVILAVAVVVGVLRVAASLAGRLVITAVIALIAAWLWLYGTEVVGRLAG